MRRAFYIGMICFAALLATVGCSTQKNTAKTRWWHSFNARYNTYFNGSQAFIEGNLEKEKGNKDNYTEMIPLYMVGNKQSRDIGKSQYERTIEKCEKAIRRHSIKSKPEWKSGKRKTAEDREWLGRKEYNPFIWKAWLLLGKAQFQKGAFDEAAATFSYMTRLYQTQPLQNGVARAWLAKCYTELGWLYDAEDVIRNMSRDSMDFRAVKDWDYTYADYYIHNQEYEKAIPYLRKVISHERRSIRRAREWFLLGQILQQMGNREQAYKAYKKTIGCHPPYELELNARIAQTEVAQEGTSRQIIGKLKRMAASDNNKEYLDQIYYAIGNIYLTQNDTAQAIAAYETGSEESTRNGYEKGVLLLKLGNLYWEKELFSDAQRCYGEAIGLLDKEYREYETLSARSKVLDELVPHTDAIHLQDSLLALSAMPEAERNEAIDRVIEALKKKEEEEREAQLDSEAEQMQQQREMLDMPSTERTPQPPSASTASNGQWYFYNPIAVRQGKETFQRQWGKRENADNWQRINQTVVNLGQDSDSEEPELPSDSLETAEQAPIDSLQNETQTDSLAKDPHQREYYLAQIPFTDEQKTACHNLIKDALFNAGIIFKDKLDNLKLSEKQLLRLTDDYPDYEHLDEAWYHLFLLYSRLGNNQRADTCLAKLKDQYPESEWTILLSDPYYAENAVFGEHIEDSLYAATYDAFKNNQTEIVRANTKLSAERFPQGANRAKFIFINGLSLLNDGDGDGCLEQLTEVVEKHPSSEVSELAGMIIKGVQNGKKLYGGKFDIGDVWTRRDVVLSADSVAADTLSADPHQNFYFILAFHPDSINGNQLLFEMARYNFTNFLVRNFDIEVNEDNGLQRMLISGFLNYDEALQYARQLYDDKTMSEKLKGCRSLIISESNLALVGNKYSYDDYLQFYEGTFMPMKISEEQLLIIPEDMEQPDIEEIEAPSQEPADEEDSGDDLFPDNSRQSNQVKDFDFGEDFW